MLFAGCAGGSDPFVPPQPSPAEKAGAEGRLLSAAGFTQIPVDTPKRSDRMASFVPLQVQYLVGPSGKLHYWMADPYSCVCLYRGSEEAYQRYEKLLTEEKFNAQEARTTNEAYESSMAEQMDWQMDEMNPYAVGFGPMWGW